MPRFFGSANEDELARRQAVGTGVRQVSPDAPAQPRFFGNRSIPNAPGRTPTMFSNVPGDRSLLERDMMRSARGSGASRRALAAERQEFNSAQEQTQRIAAAEQRRKEEREDKQLDRQSRHDTARDAGTGAATVGAQGNVDVQTLKGSQALEQLTEKQRGDLDAITKSFELKREEIRLTAGLSLAEKSALLAQGGRQEIEKIRETLGADVALAVAMKRIEAAVTQTQSESQEDIPAPRDENGKLIGGPKVKVNKTTGTTFTPPEGLPGQGEQGEGAAQVDADQNGIDDNAKWSDPASGETLNMNDIANFVTTFQKLEKSNPSSRWVQDNRAQSLSASKQLQAWLRERTSAAPTTQGQ
jgi:hypothetical protein